MLICIGELTFGEGEMLYSKGGYFVIKACDSSKSANSSGFTNVTSLKALASTKDSMQ